MPYDAQSFEERMAERIGDFVTPEGRRVTGGSTHPLAFAAEEFWYQGVLQSNEPTYRGFDAVLIDGRLDVATFALAIGDLAQRHDAFRIVYDVGADGPVMRYRDDAELPFVYSDASADAVGRREAFVAAYVRAAVRRPFAWDAAPPARVELLRLAADEHLLLVVMDDIIRDGASEGLLMRDLSASYAARANRCEPDLPAMPIDLATYARRQRELDDADFYERNIAFWTAELDGVVPAEVLGDRPRPPLYETAGARVYRTIAPATLERLRAFARDGDDTLFTILATAFAYVLHRYGGSDDVPIAFPATTRTAETENLVGTFATTLIFRARFDRDGTVRELIRRSRDVIRAGIAHRDVPFARVVERLAPERRADQLPLAAAHIVLRDAETACLTLPGCRTQRLEIDVGSAKFDLGLELDTRPEGLVCKLEYRTKVYTEAMAGRIADAFVATLDAFVNAADDSYEDIDFRPAAERARIDAWTRGPERPHAGTLVRLVMDAAAAYPERPAIVTGERSESYSELAFEATQIARALGKDGARTPIALWADRSPAMIAGMLGILAAGRAYVPLDPTYPAARLQAMVRASGATIVLATRATQRRAENATGARVLAIEDAIANADATSDLPTVMPGDAAYVMFTSGTTGVPNAVVVEHGSVVNYLAAFRRVCKLVPDDRIVQFASPSFDISVEEIFGALTSGAALVLPPPGIARSARLVLEECRARGATVLDLPTNYLREIADVLASDAAQTWPERLRLVVVGGEALVESVARPFVERAGPGVRLVNSYGPTETTIAVTLSDVTDLVRETGGAPIPLGAPIDNVCFAVIDERGRDVPIGVPGELRIAGAALARGYDTRSGSVPERFVDDPVRGRTFRTGDIVRYRADGALEFRGRRDAQTKVRGFRVELAEIEAVLAADPRVAHAAVVVDRGRLYAFAVPRNGAPAGDLRAILRETLPPFAIPNTIEWIERIPTTPVGKRDDAALRARAQRMDDAKQPPLRVALYASVTERMLATIWEELLGTSSIDPNDDFFELGGHSLLAARMFARVEAETGRRVPLQHLHAHPTIATLALVLADADARASLVTIHEAERTGAPVFFFHGDFIGGGLYTHRLARELALDRPLVALAPHGSDEGPIPRTIGEMAAAYVALIREIRPHGPYDVGGHCLGALIAIEVARQLRDAGESVTSVFAIEPPAEHAIVARAAFGIFSVTKTAPESRIAERISGLLKRCWHWLDRLIDPTRRKEAFEPFRWRFATYVLRRGSPPRNVVSRVPSWRDAIGEKHYPAAMGWTMRPYHGAVTIAYGAESPRVRGTTAGWRSVAPAIRFVTVPGEHNTCVSRYVGDLATAYTRVLSGTS